MYVGSELLMVAMAITVGVVMCLVILVHGNRGGDQCGSNSQDLFFFLMYCRLNESTLGDTERH